MTQSAVEQQLEILFQRANYLAHTVEIGALQFLDAIDLSWDAAEWAGLVKMAGSDRVQQVLARAFMKAPRGNGTESISWGNQ
jgi:hypothetical protein